MIPTETGARPKFARILDIVTVVTEQNRFVSLEIVNRESAFEKCFESGLVLDQERGAMDFNELLALKTCK
jgi:hypothetical protein